MKMKSIGATLGALVLGAVILGGCSGSNGIQTAALNNDQAASADSLHQLQISQPTPQYKWSQLRESLIEIENAQATSGQTTTFFFNQGVTAPIDSCPSIGLPIASDTQLTNPQQVINPNQQSGASQGTSGVAVGQSDPTGVYTGASTGTYFVCVSCPLLSIPTFAPT